MKKADKVYCVKTLIVCKLIRGLVFIWDIVHLIIIIIRYVFFITLLHELLCIYKKTNIYNNAMIGDFKIQNAS